MATRMSNKNHYMTLARMTLKKDAGDRFKPINLSCALKDKGEFIPYYQAFGGRRNFSQNQGMFHRLFHNLIAILKYPSFFEWSFLSRGLFLIILKFVIFVF